jgi:hypothetical protein
MRDSGFDGKRNRAEKLRKVAALDWPELII